MKLKVKHCCNKTIVRICLWSKSQSKTKQPNALFRKNIPYKQNNKKECREKDIKFIQVL